MYLIIKHKNQRDFDEAVCHIAQRDVSKFTKVKIAGVVSAYAANILSVLSEAPLKKVIFSTCAFEKGAFSTVLKLVGDKVTLLKLDYCAEAGISEHLHELFGHPSLEVLDIRGTHLDPDIIEACREYFEVIC